MTEDVRHEPPEVLWNLVQNTKVVWPGWMVYIGIDNEGGGWPVLHIVSQTPDSYAPFETMRVNHSFLIPMADYNERTWQAWIMERLVDVFRHEAGEILEFRGEKLFAPHHGNGENPYITWYVGDKADIEVKAGETKP